MGQMKVMFFTTGMSAGGAERVIATLANELAERGNEAVVAMLKGERSAYALDSRVRLKSANLQPGVRNLVPAVAFYRDLLRKESPDVIASFSTKSDLIALLHRSLTRGQGRLIVSERADPNARNRQMQLACDRFYGLADALVCQSESVAGYYRRHSRQKNIRVIPNPLNVEAVGDMPPSYVKRSGVLAIGRLSRQKNHRLAIEAFAEIHREFPEETLTIFGAGPLEHELVQLIQENGLSDSVTLGGVESNVFRTHENASMFLFTSDFEGYPNALMEAAAAGVPCVTTDFSPGTASQIVTHGRNGFVVPRRDKDALVGAARQVLSGELDPSAMIAESETVRDRHQVGRILDAWLEVFGEQ